MSLILSLRNACAAAPFPPPTATAQILLGHIHPYGLLSTLRNGYEDNGCFVLQRNNDVPKVKIGYKFTYPNLA